MDNVLTYRPEIPSFESYLLLKDGSSLDLPIPTLMRCWNCYEFAATFPVMGLDTDKTGMMFYCNDCLNKYIDSGIRIKKCDSCPTLVTGALCWICSFVKSFDEQEARGKRKPVRQKRRITPITNPFI